MKREYWIAMLPFYLLVGILVIGVAGAGSRVVTVVSEDLSVEREHIFVIDAGHGYPDGGATSCTGVLESTINLQIAQRLDDLFHFLGYETVMTRKTEDSIYTQGNTIGAKKVSDMKERLRIINSTPDAVLISIHQNTFPDSRYGGPQVLYAPNNGSREVASALQSALKAALDPASKRVAKRGSGVYLLEQADTAAVLVECGFLSNPEEEVKLRSHAYQLQLCCTISATVSSHFYP